MRIAVLGSGAVGGYYGAKLARAGHDVTFIARGAHLRAIRERGLEVRSPMLGDFTVQAQAMAALLQQFATRPELRASVKKEFEGLKALFGDYIQALEKTYTLPKIADKSQR